VTFFPEARLRIFWVAREAPREEDLLDRRATNRPLRIRDGRMTGYGLDAGGRGWTIIGRQPTI
jgi:hypothetical protein